MRENLTEFQYEVRTNNQTFIEKTRENLSSVLSSFESLLDYAKKIKSGKNKEVVLAVSLALSVGGIGKVYGSESVESGQVVVEQEEQIREAEFWERNEERFLDWIERNDYSRENIGLKEIADDRFLIYDEKAEHPLRIVSMDLEYQIPIDIREGISDNNLRAFELSAKAAGYKIEFEDGNLRIFEHRLTRKTDEEGKLSTQLEGEKGREIDIFSAEFAEVWDTIDFVNMHGQLTLIERASEKEMERNFDYEFLSFVNDRGIARLKHIIKSEEYIPEENFKEHIKTAKENLIDQIGDERYNYLHDPVTREELDAYFHGGTIEYPRGNEIQIPAGTISEELYETAIQKLEEVEQARQERIEEEKEQVEIFKMMMDGVFD